jgi:hypothetical protein
MFLAIKKILSFVSTELSPSLLEDSESMYLEYRFTLALIKNVRK